LRLLLGACVVCCAPAPGPIPSTPTAIEPAPTPVEEEPASSGAPDPVPAASRSWPPDLGRTDECKACLPQADQPCAAKRDACTGNAACVAYLECTRACPPPGSRDDKGGYPQADCVITCREKSTEGADLGDGYLWCTCCDSPCKTACGSECGHFKSGIAGPIGAGCD
jgi:hypothetical protein